jgi:hypothetical protein
LLERLGALRSSKPNPIAAHDVLHRSGEVAPVTAVLHHNTASQSILSCRLLPRSPDQHCVCISAAGLGEGMQASIDWCDRKRNKRQDGSQSQRLLGYASAVEIASPNYVPVRFVSISRCCNELMRSFLRGIYRADNRPEPSWLKCLDGSSH